MINILDIHNQILKKIKDKEDDIVKLYDKLKYINDILINEDIKDSIKRDLIENKKILQEEIDNIENKKSLNFYILESFEMINTYKDLLNTPVKVMFDGSITKSNKNLKKIVDEYINIACKYIDIDIKTDKKITNLKIKCDVCKNVKDFDMIDNNIFVCILCSSEQIVLRNESSFKDINRINITSKYMYDRKVHFKTSISQYQAKQNSTVSDEVYQQLIKEFEANRLLIGDENTPKHIRFSKITKDIIFMFLKQLDLNKHYENLTLIYAHISGQKADDISHLENQLLSDFDQLTDAYNILYKDIERTNFINSSYVLYQLLKRHKHPCHKSDFNILKTIERSSFHDEVCKELFLYIGWSFEHPFF